MPLFCKCNLKEFIYRSSLSAAERGQNAQTQAGSQWGTPLPLDVQQALLEFGLLGSVGVCSSTDSPMTLTLPMHANANLAACISDTSSPGFGSHGSRLSGAVTQAQSPLDVFLSPDLFNGRLGLDIADPGGRARPSFPQSFHSAPMLSTQDVLHSMGDDPYVGKCWLVKNVK